MTVAGYGSNGLLRDKLDLGYHRASELIKALQAEGILGCELDRFASALHQTVLNALRSHGHEVTDLDLYADGFRPVMSREERKEYEDPAQYRETVEKYALQLSEAEASGSWGW